LFRELLHEYRLYANRVGVLELPPGYEVEAQIGKNIARRLLGFYRGRLLLFGLLLLALALAVLRRRKNA
jgi:arylsulfatase/uncharacterized sulfatase